MGLGSVLQTALSGLSAAETMLAVTADNLANARTSGYKASSAVLATQGARSIGRGDGNPMQIGLGVTVAATPRDLTQGTIALNDDPMSLAVQGEGMFILDGPAGERFFSRDGHFQLNANRELVNADGDRVLGYGVDGNYRLQTGQLVPLRIPMDRPAATAGGRAASMTGYAIQADGRIQGRYSDGRWRDLGQIRLARFNNASGMVQRAGNRASPGPNSGLPIESAPGEDGAGVVLSGATELSNTDIGRSLVDLQLASMQFRVNLAPMSTGMSLLDELVRIRRMPG